MKLNFFSIGENTYEAVLRIIIAVFLLWVGASEVCADIVNTRHNLSAWSPYASSAGADSLSGDMRRNRICIFCHTPHNADSTQAPLWGHMPTSTAVYNVASSTLGKVQPDGISKKCLGCHDGTVAVGAVITYGEIPMKGDSIDLGTGALKLGSIGYIGTDIDAHYHHAVSINYSSAAFLKEQADPGKFQFPLSDYNKKVLLDKDGKIQCSSCHNPHNDGGDTYLGYLEDSAPSDPLWRKEMDCACRNGSVCGSCHLWARDDAVPCPASVYDAYYSPLMDGIDCSLY